VPAFDAGAGGIGGWYRNGFTSSLFSFGGQHFQEQPPSRVQYGVVQTGFRALTVREELPFVVGIWFGFRPPGHVVDPQGFVADDVMILDEFQGGLMGVIQSLPANRPMQGGNLGGGFLAPVRPALATGQHPLGGGELNRCGLPEPGVGQEPTLAGDRQRCDAHVSR
jgi:hypothetical protein